MDIRQLTRDRIEKIGYESTVQYSKTKQTLTFIELARAIDPELPPILLLSILREDAVFYGDWEYFVRSTFVRCVIEKFPDGWMTGPKIEFRRASVYGSWCSCVGVVADSATTIVRDRIRAENSIPKGWKPTGVDDEVVVKVFADINFQVPTRAQLNIGS